MKKAFVLILLALGVGMLFLWNWGVALFCSFGLLCAASPSVFSMIMLAITIRKPKLD